jgi:uncharacterized protein
VRAVLDPNVVISGLLSQAGSPAQVLRAWREGRFQAIVSPLLLAELERALTYPKLRKRIPASDADAAVRWLQGAATVVDDPTEHHPPVHSEDPGDDYLIALAARERAALVSGDRHLLALSARIPVYSPRGFLDILR